MHEPIRYNKIVCFRIFLTICIFSVVHSLVCNRLVFVFITIAIRYVTFTVD